jgi:hypothetical protein
MACLLIIGRDEDLCCQLVRERLVSLGRQVLYLPEDQLFPGLRIAWELISGIATSPEGFRTKEGQYLSSEWHALMRGYVQNLAWPVVNRLRPELWYKGSLQVHELLSLAPNLNFRLARSTISTKFDDARTFFELCDRRMRYSPLTLPSRYVIETQEDLQRLEPLSKVLPLYLTEVAQGDAADTYVVGDDVIFNSVSNAAVGEHCRDIAASLQLTFCQFHLIRTTDDEWCCERSTVCRLSKEVRGFGQMSSY